MLSQPAQEEDSPTTFGRFLLVERLAAGGMAEVYASRPLRTSRLPRVVAIKRMLPEIAARGDFIDMFVDEAKLVSRLEHENIVRSYEYGREAGSYYIAMEMLSGLDMSRLSTLVSRRRRRIPPEIAAWIAEQVCAGLAHAHALEDENGKSVGLIHRDVTPHNLIVGFDGSVKIIDFGIAKSAIQRAQTTVGMLKGKVCYMSPEQATRTARIDYRSDIYSTGVCLWEWLAGRRMFSPELHFLKTLKKVRAADFKPIETLRPGLPEELTAIVAKALSKDPDDRYQSGEEMRQALEKYREKRCSMPKRALRRWLDRELADQRMKHEKRLESISATPVPEGTIAYHPELEVVAAKTRVAKKIQSSFVEAPTEVFFSVDIELEGEGEDDEEFATTAAATDIDVELPSWDRDSSGIQTRTDVKRLKTRRKAQRRDGAVSSTLVDETPWWGAYAEIAPPDDWADEDAKTSKVGAADETPRLIDTMRPQEHLAQAVAPKKARRRGTHPGFFVAAAAAAAALLGVGFHFAQQQRSGAGQVDTGVLQVRLATEVDAATVFVDGVERGAAPLTLGTLQPGSHQVRVVAEGFVDVIQEVEVASGATTIVAASLGELRREANETDVQVEPVEPVELVAEVEPATMDLGREPPEMTEQESERQDARDARQAREERWARLQEYRARQARIEARQASTATEVPEAPVESAQTAEAAEAPAPAPRPQQVTTTQRPERAASALRPRADALPDPIDTIE